MAKGFKHGAGGISTLNFHVVINPKPDYPKENTIWINTDTPISYYEFSGTQPTAAQEGALWVCTGSQGQIKFNALKKNGIQVYPFFARQYVGGAWVDKTARIYQGGAWVDWIQYLYNLGNEFPETTGGWVARAHASITKGEEYLTVTKTTDNSAWISTANAIDFTNVARIEADYSNTNSSGSSGMFLQNGTPPSSGGADWSKKVAKVFDTSTGGLNSYKTMTLNTEAITGTYLVYFIMYYGGRIKSVRIFINKVV